jgi:hypothetical protein
MGSVPGIGLEWDERILADSASEEAEMSEAGVGVDWDSLMMTGIIAVILFVLAIAIIRQFHLYWVFEGRKT